MVQAQQERRRTTRWVEDVRDSRRWRWQGKRGGVLTLRSRKNQSGQRTGSTHKPGSGTPAADEQSSVVCLK